MSITGQMYRVVQIVDNNFIYIAEKQKQVEVECRNTRPVRFIMKEAVKLTDK